MFTNKINNKLNNICVSVLLGVNMLCMSSLGQAAVVEFNTGDLSQFTVNGTGHDIAASVGVGGSSGLSKTTTFSSTSLVFNTPFQNSMGMVMNTSVMYKNTQEGSSGPDVRLGFSSSLTTGLFNGNDVYVETCCGTGDGTISDYFTSGLAGINSFPIVTTILNDWYDITLELTNVDGIGAYTGVTTLSHFGATGTGAGNLLATNTFSFTNASLAANASLYAGFSSHNAVTGYDNFTADEAQIVNVSVPPSLALLMLSVVGLRLAKRKKE